MSEKVTFFAYNIAASCLCGQLAAGGDIFDSLVAFVTCFATIYLVRLATIEMLSHER